MNEPVVIVRHFGPPMCIGSILVKLGIYIVPHIISVGKIHGISVIGSIQHVERAYAQTTVSFLQAISPAETVNDMVLCSTVSSNGGGGDIHGLDYFFFLQNFS